MPTASQVPGTLNFRFPRGDEYRAVVSLPALNLTGYTLTAEVFSLGSGAVLATIVPVFTTPPHEVTFVFTASITGALLPGDYGIRVKWITAAGKPRRFLAGFVGVLP